MKESSSHHSINTLSEDEERSVELYLLIRSRGMTKCDSHSGSQFTQ